MPAVRAHPAEVSLLPILARLMACAPTVPDAPQDKPEAPMSKTRTPLGESLLKMLYSPGLTPGMTVLDARPIVFPLPRLQWARKAGSINLEDGHDLR